VSDFYRSQVKLHDGSPRTRHVSVELGREPEAPDGTVVVRSVYVVTQDLDGEARAIVAGRYVDRFGRADGGWRFLERRFFVDVAGDLSDHLHIGIA
jgi:hypothetical protein